MSSKKISVIIPTYMAGDLLLDAVKSVKEAAVGSSIDIKIIVIDNSPDKDDQFIASEVAIYSSLPSNPGFGAASNHGLFLSNKFFESTWYFILNPDARIDETFFSILTKVPEFNQEECTNPIIPLICFDEPVLRLVDPRIIKLSLEGFQIVDPSDSFCVFDRKGEPVHFFDSSVKTIPVGGHLCLKETVEVPRELIVISTLLGTTVGQSDFEILELLSGNFAEDFLVQNAGSEIHSHFSAGDLMTGWLASVVSKSGGGPRRAWCGAGVLIPQLYLEKNGSFDERFFLYYEDTELSYRGILNETLPVLYPNLIIKHKHSALTGKNSLSRSKSIWRSRSAFVSLTSGHSYSIILIGYLLARSFNSLIRGRVTLRHFHKFLLPEVLQSLVGFSKSILPKPNRGF